MRGATGVEPVITSRNLRKMYGPHLALDDINLDIPPGAIGILGPNGAGKSTLFKCLLGLITTTSGEGTVLGYDIRTEGDKIRSRIGYMPEYDALDPGLSAVDQVRYSGELLGMNPAHATRRAHEVLQYVGLKEQRYRKIETYSTGMKQAAKLACALVHDPDVLICDEPTNGLDQRAREFMLQTLKKTVTEGNRTVLMSSHVMDDVQEVCDRIVMIHQGKIVVQRRIEDLANRVEREIEISVWGGASRMQAELESNGFTVRRMGRVLRVIRMDDSTTSEILNAAVNADVQVRQMQEYDPDLEDIFLLIMDRLGAEVKSTSDLMTEGHTGGDESA
ncbi:MAG: ABC transporter [Euryarchaeota archaeon]|uniref:ABC transporter related protein (ABC-2.A) n=2 Tax=environmental samples TaxID=68359 RepID=A0A075HVE5_9EURY|nr:ABC transporter related protein (ABC-2.A) [uncultured marine group II/III euryarchaeote KM3_87_C01]MAQ57533.1 ABC transporter [Euryarchaeota archaeon]